LGKNIPFVTDPVPSTLNVLDIYSQTKVHMG